MNIILSIALGVLVYTWLRIRQKRAKNLNLKHLIKQMDMFMSDTYMYSETLRDAGIFVIEENGRALPPFRIGG